MFVSGKPFQPGVM